MRVVSVENEELLCADGAAHLLLLLLVLPAAGNTTYIGIQPVT
jgi:hypothetical protein